MIAYHNLTAFSANGKGHLWIVGIFCTSSVLTLLYTKNYTQSSQSTALSISKFAEHPINCIIYF